ncbi:MAG: glycoside hydrolase family 9 protein [Ruminococcus sp.]|nr:glycoside hydrolase family 9 protein [Ruminococcus sp.]
MKRKYTNSAMAILLGVMMLSGCEGLESPPAGTADAGQEEEIESLGLVPEFNYEVPVSLPDIMIDQVGYALKSNKIAVFRGEVLPDTYDLIDAETEEVVYTGSVKRKGYNILTEEVISYGDFSDFARPGTYYLQADIIGRSYPFVIADNPYSDIFTGALKCYYYNRCGLMLSNELAGDKAHNACHTKTALLKEDTTVELDVSGGWHIDENGQRDVIKGCQAIDNLLLAYELYGSVFTDGIGIPESGNDIPDILDEVKYEIDWLLKMQDAASGAVYSAVSMINNPDSTYQMYVDSVSMDATIHFAATMAKFSYLYQSYDMDFATQCLRAADRAYRYAENYPQDASAEAFFYAAAELYRATGNYSYRNVIHQYLNDNEVVDMGNDPVFWGCVTYLSTKQRVDVNLCEKVIKILLSDVEDISYASKNSKYLTEGNKEQTNNRELLQKMVRLAVVDHIITNHEYMTVLENHLHYFLGRNGLSISYIDDTGSRNYDVIDEKTGIMKQIDSNAELIVILSTIEAELDGSGENT